MPTRPPGRAGRPLLSGATSLLHRKAERRGPGRAAPRPGPRRSTRRRASPG